MFVSWISISSLLIKNVVILIDFGTYTIHSCVLTSTNNSSNPRFLCRFKVWQYRFIVQFNLSCLKHGASTQPVFARTSGEAWNCDKPIASQQQFGPMEWSENGQVTSKENDRKQLWSSPNVCDSLLVIALYFQNVLGLKRFLINESTLLHSLYPPKQHPQGTHHSAKQSRHV